MPVDLIIFSQQWLDRLALPLVGVFGLAVVELGCESCRECSCGHHGWGGVGIGIWDGIEDGMGVLNAKTSLWILD